MVREVLRFVICEHDTLHVGADEELRDAQEHLFKFVHRETGRIYVNFPEVIELQWPLVIQIRTLPILEAGASASHISFVPLKGIEMAETMSPGPAPAAMPQSDTRVLAIIVYGLYLVGWPCLHLPTVAGLILAYIKRGEVRGTIWESHFANQIETFWVSLVLFIVAIPLCFVVIGVPILIGTVIWFLYRTIKGLVRAIENQPYY